MDKLSMLDTTTPRTIEEYGNTVISRISDYNSNTYEKEDTNIKDTRITDDGNYSYVSSILSQEIDFIQDNSDYQWFADYSYRGNANSLCNNMHTSILSSLCTSYGYNDMARDLDANLAQVDMEDFRTEDIQSFLQGLPQICCTDVHNEKGGEMFASVTGSLMIKYNIDSAFSPPSCSSQEDSSESIYKSEILFSPVREVPMVSFSIDSLDCEEPDIMLTCQANKDNYTIAFEGSTLMEKSVEAHCQNSNNNEVLNDISEEGNNVESVERMSTDTTSSGNSTSATQVDKNFISKSPLICSESPYTTWSKLKEDSVESTLKRQSSGNNNTVTFTSSIVYPDITASCAFLKSQSLPNLNPVKRHFLLSRMVSSTKQESFLDEKVSSSQPNQFMKIYNLSRSRCGRKIHRSVFQNNVNFDLITQFINQKHNNYRASESAAGSQSNSVGCLSNNKFSKTYDNLNVSSVEKISELDTLPDDTGSSSSSAVHRRKVNVFEDSLVADRNLTADEMDRSVEEMAMDDSCSSFSSHSGRLDLLKKIDNLENKELTLPLPCANDSSRKAGVSMEAATDFLKKRYFESSRQFERELKKRKAAGKRYVSGIKPIKIMDRSMQTSSSDGDSVLSPTSAQKGDTTSINKSVYVMFPNYTLPDLTFLQEHATELDLKNVFLWPQKFSPSPTTEHASAFAAITQTKTEPCEERPKKKKRPCSCPDFDAIRNKDFQHIRDWESLMFLLPREYCQILLNVPELKKQVEKVEEIGCSLICTSGMEEMESEIKTGCTSNCSTGTQPSSGFRGSSTLLTDSGGSAEQQQQQGKGYANRPPLPKGILRNPAVQSIKSRKNQMNTKRYSMFELSSEDKKCAPEKRRSLPSQFSSAQQQKKPSDKDYFSEDEGVDSSGSHCDSPCPQNDQDARRLEHLLENAFHWNEEDTSQLRYQAAKKTVSFADRHNRTPPNSPNASISGQHKTHYQMKLHSAFDSAIHEECEASRHSYCDHVAESSKTSSYNYKKELIEAVEEATKRICSVASSGTNEEAAAQIVLNHLCPALYAILNHGLKPTIETAFGDINNSVWQVVEGAAQQGPMTRALHELVLRLNNEDVLTEGLLKFNAFIFGLLNVHGLDTWFSYLRTRESILKKHYIEQGIMLSSSKGIMSDRQLTDQLLSILRPLANITFKLDLLYECRLLHQSLLQLEQNSPIQSGHHRTSWVLKKIVRSLQSVTGDEDDSSISTRSSLCRPRSCVDSANASNFNDGASSVKKRWSGIQFGSKLASAFERLAIDDEDVYTDSLDQTLMAPRGRPRKVPANVATLVDNNVSSVSDSNTEADLSVMHNELYDPRRDEEEMADVPMAKREIKFKQLQKKWEMLAEKQSPDSGCRARGGVFSSKSIEESDTPTIRSRIPRPVTSPVRPPSSLHFTVAPSRVSSASSSLRKSPSSPSSNIPTAVKKMISPTNAKKVGDLDSSKSSKTKHRSSRVDETVPSNHPVRPNSLPQRSQRYYRNKTAVDKEERKRPSSSSGRYQSAITKYVRTLGHRLPSDNGHLSYNEGEKLRVVLEVDDKWILCCRGDQKGLVPRSAVLPISGHL